MLPCSSTNALLLNLSFQPQGHYCRMQLWEQVIWFTALYCLFCGQVKVVMPSLVHHSSRTCDEEGKMSGETAVLGRLLTLSATPICSSLLFWQLLLSNA